MIRFVIFKNWLGCGDGEEWGRSGGRRPETELLWSSREETSARREDLAVGGRVSPGSRGHRTEVLKPYSELSLTEGPMGVNDVCTLSSCLAGLKDAGPGSLPLQMPVSL